MAPSDDPLATMPRPVPVLAGGCVRLRPAEPVTDAPAYLALYADPRIATHVRDVVPTTAAAAAAELARLTAMPQLSLWLITDRVSSAVLGRYFLTRWRAGARVLVGEGVRVAPAAWRTGVHRHARALLMAYAFTVLQADAVVTKARIGHARMIAAALAYGFCRGADEGEDAETFATFTLERARWQAGIAALAVPS